MSFPKGLSYSYNRMQGFSKQIDKIYPDRKDSVTSGSTIRTKFNNNSLIILRTVSMYYDFTCPAMGTANTEVFWQHRFAPRLSSSIIENIGVYMNSYLIDQVNDYNLLYNTIYDMSAGVDQDSKRYLENIDPSVKYHETLAAAGSTIFAVNTNLTASQTINVDTDNVSDTNRQFVINNFCNFFGTSSTEFLDTNDVSDLELNIKLAPKEILWHSGAGAHAVDANTSAAEYTLNNIYFTYERVMLEDPLYFEIKRAKLMSNEGLEIKFTAYSTHNGPLQSRAINYSFNTSGQSIDSIICTTRRTDYKTENYLQLTGYMGANSGAATGNFKAKLALTAGAPDLFNQSIYFRRDLSGLTDSQITINGTRVYKSALKPFEIFNENIIALNDQANLFSGVHPGCNSLPAFLKYYFCNILSLNYNGETSIPMISGLDGRGGSINIEWQTNANTAVVTSEVYPVVFVAKSQIIRINAGRQITIT